MAAGRLMAFASAEAARHAAQSILSEGRFHSSPVPDPLHNTLVSIGRAVQDPFSAFGRLVNNLGTHFPGGGAGLWVAAAVLLLVVTAALTARRAKTRLDRSVAEGSTSSPGPAQLERAAERAERDGRWDEAVRLRFRAGLMRLGERSGLRNTDTTPNHSLARIVHSERLDQLSDRFDEIAYGGDDATAADADHQRRAWPEIIAGGER
jgi:Domain of unknown function (DUF4129)